MTVRVYRSSDAGAPQITAADHSQFAAVLDACLVDGFGSFQPLGWSKVYSDASSNRCYRAPQGDRKYLQVSKNVADMSFARVCCFDTYIGLDEGTNRIPNTLLNGNTSNVGSLFQPADGLGYYWHYFYGNHTDWVLVGDEKTFYLFLKCFFDATTPAFTICAAFGELDPYLPGELSNTFLVGYVYDSAITSSAWFEQITGANYSHYSSTNNWRYFGICSPSRSRIHPHFPVKPTILRPSIPAMKMMGTGPSMVIGAEGFEYPDLITGSLHACRIQLYDFDGINTSNGSQFNTLGSLHGHFRGMLAPCHSRPLGDGGQISLNGTTYEQFNLGFPNSGCVLIALSNW